MPGGGASRSCFSAPPRARALKASHAPRVVRIFVIAKGLAPISGAKVFGIMEYTSPASMQARWADATGRACVSREP